VSSLKRRVIVSALFAGALGSLGPVGRADETTASEPRDPVVLELFTSQGCSSCPPAERILTHLGLDEKTKASVIPLAFHVDYWNVGGWTDPFSAPEWSMRQDAYGRALRVADGNYTPQLVVSGRTQFNGSNERRARTEIAAELERPAAARVSLTARKDGATLVVEVGAVVTDGVAAGKLKAMVALFENGVVTRVARGENGGHTLQNDFIVRRLETAFSLEAKAGARKQQTVRLKLDPAWKPENVGVAAFLQDSRSMRIHGAAALQPVP
jgi:hypothetical protein